MLVGAYILAEACEILHKDAGLYMDDGLAVVTKPAAICQANEEETVFKVPRKGLKITATANTKQIFSMSHLT